MEHISKENQKWELPSGMWTANAEGGDFAQISSRHGHALAPALIEWIRTGLVPVSFDAAAGSAFPPEFKFHPLTGAALGMHATPRNLQQWMPPCGNSRLAEPGNVRGLRQTPQSLTLSRLAVRSETDNPEHEMLKPGAGDFEFFSVPCATLEPMLLAMDPARGQLYAWAEPTQRWMPLMHSLNGLLGECHQVSDEGWRGEVVLGDAFSSTLFVPTDDGLAAIRVDVPALVFDVTYLGAAASIGSPILFADHIWAPVRKLGEPLRFICSNGAGELISEVVVSGADVPQVFGHMQTPVADMRRAFWMCDEGYLQLERKSDGSCVATFTRWPSDLVPSFQFGAPFLANNGDLWQICWCAAKGQYEYINLISAQLLRQEASRPLMCTGSMSYRYVQRVTDEPWYEPEHGVDGGQTRFLLPMLESSSSKAVLGLRVNAAGSLKETLDSNEKLRAELVCDSGGVYAFNSIAVREPWRMRFFVHDNKLWAFHVDLPHIQGWELQA